MPSRGERNNNPLNIRLSKIKWSGELPASSDSSFEQFESPAAGIRAGAKLLLNYQKIYNLRTIDAIISRFAPSNENDTRAYVDHVCKLVSVDKDESIDLRCGIMLAKLVKAVITHENGKNSYPDDLINSICERVVSNERQS